MPDEKPANDEKTEPEMKAVEGKPAPEGGAVDQQEGAQSADAGEGAAELPAGEPAPALSSGDAVPQLTEGTEGAPAIEGVPAVEGAPAVEGGATLEGAPAAEGAEADKPHERTFADELREQYGDIETANMDDLPDLERKRDRLNAMAEEHKAKRDRLNSVTKQLAEERDRLNAQVRELVQKANDHRNNRNKLNVEVREAKKLRDELNKKANELNEVVTTLKKEKIVETGGPSLSRLRKELNDLDFKLMTSVLTADKEKEMMGNIQKIQALIREQESKMEEHREIRTAVRDARKAKEDAEHQHKLVSELARKAQSEHDSMIQLYETADELRKQADGSQQKFITNKQLADAEHKQHIELIRKVHDYDKFISGLRRRERRARKDRQETVQKKVAEDIVEKFKKGEKLSTEDLLSLQNERF